MSSGLELPIRRIRPFAEIDPDPHPETGANAVLVYCAAMPLEKTYEWGTMPEMFGPRHEHRIGFILRETAKLERGRLLEAAIGLGQMARRLSGQGHRVFGVDGSFDAALFVKRNTPVPVVIGDLTRLPFRDRVFGVVTSGETLEHIPDDSAAVGEFARVLEEDGSCVVTVPALELLRNRSDTYYEHLRRYSRSQLSGLFLRAGMNVEKARFWGFPLVLAYDIAFILPLNMRRRSRDVESDPMLRSAATVGRSRLLVNFVRAVFSIDRLFGLLPFGPGLLLVARKR